MERSAIITGLIRANRLLCLRYYENLKNFTFDIYGGGGEGEGEGGGAG